MSSSVPKVETPRRRRRTTAALLLAGTLLLFAAVFSQSWFNLTFLRPSGGEETLVFAALSALIFLLLVTLTFILARNVLKLYAERRVGVLGSKFRTRMVIGALVLSFAPVILLCFFAYGLMNRSIVKWYSRPVEEVRENTATVASMLAQYAATNARAEAQSIADAPDTARAFTTGNFTGVVNEFRRHESTLQGGFAVALTRADKTGDVSDGDAYNAEASFHAPLPWPVLLAQLKHIAPGSSAAPFDLGGTPFMLGVAPVAGHGMILVAVPLPQQFTQTLNRLDASRRWYMDVAAQLKQVRRTYIGILLLVTLLVLFAATWLALFVGKLVTRPVAALAEATQEISRGRLDHRVAVAAADELGDLVVSFNNMADQLQSSRQQLEDSSRSLQRANLQLDQRRKEIETILESIPTGVLSIGPSGIITHANGAFVRMFSPGATKPPVGDTLHDLFPAEVISDIAHLLRKASRMGSTTSQLDIPLNGDHSKLDAAVTVAALRHDGRALGYVIVFEDLSDVVKAQRQAAWREVARRVAHEIKNPLTPIALSAERIKRHLERGTPDEQSLSILNSCADTIANSVDTVRTLVNEFATLARFPTAQPQPANVNAVVENALAMFADRLNGITVQTFLAADLPKAMADSESLKRAVANLIDNAAEAMRTSLVKEIHISTALISGREAVEIVVADSGHGVSADVKEKLFLPYFSTKDRGTGLGLAIVSRIVEDHHGSIRVEENLPVGARFIIELPVAPEAVSQSAAHA